MGNTNESTSFFYTAPETSSQLYVLLLSSGQSYGTKDAIPKNIKDGDNSNCNLSCLGDDIYFMNKYFQKHGAQVSVHHNNNPTINEASKWINAFFKTAKGSPKVIYYTGHGDDKGNLCISDGQMSFMDIAKLARENITNTVFIKDCCYAGFWGKKVKYQFQTTVPNPNSIYVQLLEKRCPIICSSLWHEKSIAENDGSTFTKFLLKHLPQDIDCRSDGVGWNRRVAYDKKLEKRFTNSQTSTINWRITKNIY